MKKTSDSILNMNNLPIQNLSDAFENHEAVNLG